MFGLSAGNYFYGDCVTINDATNLQGQSVVLNTKTRKLYVKMCNASADTKKATVDLSRFKSMKPVATKSTISGQPEDENNYEKQPVQPVVEQFKPKKKMQLELAPYSFVMMEISL